MKKIYLVVFDWSTEDGHDVDIGAFDSYEKAVIRYNEIIKLEKDSRYSWAADAFDKNDNLERNYELDEFKPNLEKETECYWDLTCKNDYYLRDYLSIRIKEIF